VTLFLKTTMRPNPRRAPEQAGLRRTVLEAAAEGAADVGLRALQRVGEQPQPRRLGVLAPGPSRSVLYVAAL
jgi:hypothetical protein